MKSKKAVRKEALSLQPEENRLFKLGFLMGIEAALKECGQVAGSIPDVPMNKIMSLLDSAMTGIRRSTTRSF